MRARARRGIKGFGSKSEDERADSWAVIWDTRLALEEADDLTADFFVGRDDVPPREDLAREEIAMFEWKGGTGWRSTFEVGTDKRSPAVARQYLNKSFGKCHFLYIR